jgi:predicted ABC-type ATPase
MFAGPNGSGKTTVKNNLRKQPEWFGIYINPDELEHVVRQTGSLSLELFGLTTTTEEIRTFLASSTFLQSRHSLSNTNGIECREQVLHFSGFQFDSYYASVLADFLRRKALHASQSFSFETVMSAPDKVELLREAQGLGFRTYLYYIATEDPTINIQRVKTRVAAGGHDVPEDKIVERYYRSLKLLADAIRYSNRAFFFDTSESEARYFAEVTDGTSVDLKSDEIPNRFGPLGNQFGADSRSNSGSPSADVHEDRA